MTEREIIAGLLAAQPKCLMCGVLDPLYSAAHPVTNYCQTAEIGYYLYFCDKHRRPDGYTLPHAEVVRAAEKYLMGES